MYRNSLAVVIVCRGVTTCGVFRQKGALGRSGLAAAGALPGLSGVGPMEALNRSGRES